MLHTAQWGHNDLCQSQWLYQISPASLYNHVQIVPMIVEVLEEAVFVQNLVFCLYFGPGREVLKGSVCLPVCCYQAVLCVRANHTYVECTSVSLTLQNIHHTAQL